MIALLLPITLLLPVFGAALIGQFLTVKEVSELLKVPKSWLYNHILAGTLPFPFIKVGQHFVRFKQEDIELYLQRQTHEPKATNLRAVK